MDTSPDHITPARACACRVKKKSEVINNRHEAKGSDQQDKPFLYKISKIANTWFSILALHF